EQLQALGARITKPFVDGQTVAFRFRYLLALLIEEQFIIETFGRLAAEKPGNLARQLDRIDQILAGHLIIHTQCVPAHAPIRLPLQLAVSTGDRRLEAASRLRVAPDDRAR